MNFFPTLRVYLDSARVQKIGDAELRRTILTFLEAGIYDGAKDDEDIRKRRRIVQTLHRLMSSDLAAVAVETVNEVTDSEGKDRLLSPREGDRLLTSQWQEDNSDDSLNEDELGEALDNLAVPLNIGGHPMPPASSSGVVETEVPTTL